ncbi:MAG TPA: TetR/AcrR family transcriptional regulator [Acidimicrobiales bacterium]|nr:TetR/AcrR family transcriptional regulator [Acidimicrobiales bacterium]
MTIISSGLGSGDTKRGASGHEVEVLDRFLFDRSEQEVRIIEAAHKCFSRWGVTKTTVDDIGKQAGVSRATVYRYFPSGRDSILDAVVEADTARFFRNIAQVLNRAGDLHELLISGMTEAWNALSGDDILVFLLEHEPEVVLRNLAFDKLERLVALCREILAPFMERWLDRMSADRLAEWATRVVVSYAISPPDWIELGRPAATAIVDTFFMPPREFEINNQTHNIEGVI